MTKSTKVFIAIVIFLITSTVILGFVWGFYASDFLESKITAVQNSSNSVKITDIKKIKGFFYGGINLGKIQTQKGHFNIDVIRSKIKVYPWKVITSIQQINIKDTPQTGRLNISDVTLQANGLVWSFRDKMPEIFSHGEQAELLVAGSNLTWKKWSGVWKQDHLGRFREFALSSNHFEMHKVGTIQEFHAYIDFPKVRIIDTPDTPDNLLRRFELSTDALDWKHASQGRIYQGNANQFSSEISLEKQKPFGLTQSMDFFKVLFANPVKGIETAGSEFKHHYQNGMMKWDTLDLSAARYQFKSDTGKLEILSNNPLEFRLSTNKLTWNFELLWDQYKTTYTQPILKSKIHIDKEKFHRYLESVFHPSLKPERQTEVSYGLEKTYNQVVNLFNSLKTEGRLDTEALIVGGKGLDEWFKISNVKQEFSSSPQKEGMQFVFQHNSVLEMKDQLKSIFPDLNTLSGSELFLKTKLSHLNLNTNHFQSIKKRLASTIAKDLFSSEPEISIQFNHTIDDKKLIELKGFSKLFPRRTWIPKKKQITDASTWLHTIWYAGTHKYLLNIEDQKHFKKVFGSLLVFDPVKDTVKSIKPMVKRRKNQLYMNLYRNRGKTKINDKKSRYFERSFIE